jgi:chromosome segregation ATPase
LEIQNLQTRSSRSDQAVRVAETNLSALKDEIRKANRNITALQKRASDAESRAAAAALANTKRADDNLATVKATFDNFMSEVIGKMESEFDKRTIRKMAASVAKSIATSEHGFNQKLSAFLFLRTETLTSRSLRPPSPTARSLASAAATLYA